MGDLPSAAEPLMLKDGPKASEANVDVPVSPNTGMPRIAQRHVPTPERGNERETHLLGGIIRNVVILAAALSLGKFLQ